MVHRNQIRPPGDQPKSVQAVRVWEASFFPGSFGPEQTAELFGRRQGPVEQGLKFSEGAGIHTEKRLVEQYVFSLAAGGFEHEFRAAASEAVSRLVDEIALPGLGSNID